MKKVLVLFILILPVAHTAIAGEGIQSVTASQIISGDLPFVAEIHYSSTDTDQLQGTTGIGLRCHYNSGNIGTPTISDTYEEGLIGVSIQDDVDNFDADESTDKFVLLAWISPMGDWGASNPLMLFRFTGEHALVPGSALSFTAADTAKGYAFSSKSLVAEY
jgi:hypothetical protein